LVLVGTCELYDDHGILKQGSATAGPLLSSQWLLNDGSCVVSRMGYHSHTGGSHNAIQRKIILFELFRN
jgi:hypothetical protein